MRRTTSILTALLLALAFALPGVAGAEEPEATVPAAELLPLDEANQTPVELPSETSEATEVFDLEEHLRVNSIRECESAEEFAQCAPTCHCIFSANQVWCVGC